VDEILKAAKDQLQYTLESFVNVFSLDVDPRLSERENTDKIITQSAVVGSVVFVLQPIPFTDLLLIAPLLAKMTLHIGKAKGFTITQERALEIVREIIAAVGMAWATGIVAIGFAKLIPILGGLLVVPLVYGAVFAVGRVAELYFDGMKKGTVPRADEMVELFKREFSEGKARGAALRKEDLEAAARDLKARIAAREAAKAREPRESPGTEVRELGIKVREREVKKPKPGMDEPELAEAPRGGKTIGPSSGDAPPPPPAQPEPPGRGKKTIGPALEPAAPAVPATPAAPAGAFVSELERLAKLRDVGALTPEEFETAKKKLLG
jgi:uncharacterized protein (DUF697 family)